MRPTNGAASVHARAWRLTRRSKVPRYALPAVAAILSSGCAMRGAPSFVLFGAFFPAWLLLACIAIAVSIAVRAIVVATGHGETFPLQLWVCVSVGLAVTVLLWRLWF